MNMKKMRTIISTNKISGNQSAFTLIEVLIAISILTIGLLGVAKMQITAIKGNYFSGNTSFVLKLAEEKMEDLLRINFSDNALNDTQTGNNGNLTSITIVDHEERINKAGQVVASGPYHRIWNVADDTPITNNKTVTVIVTWGNNDGHRAILSCIKSLQ